MPIQNNGHRRPQDLAAYALQTWVNTQLDALINGAPGSLNTLNELALAMGNDPNFAASVINALAAKLNLSGGTLTGALNIAVGNGAVAININSTNSNNVIIPYYNSSLGWLFQSRNAAGSTAQPITFDGSLININSANSNNVIIPYLNSSLGFYIQSRNAAGSSAQPITLDGSVVNVIPNLSVTGNVSAANLLSGTYTPGMTSATNVSSTTINTAQWMRVGNVVTVSGNLQIVVTASNTLTTFYLALPISSSFTSSSQLAGTCSLDDGTNKGSGGILGSSGYAFFTLKSLAIAGAGTSINYHYTYQIL
ncbi:MAG: hypothetical protein JWN76_1248 [Chitinophagaceae bacterium]|nr:hypothetical protein [Chitinophagaceae bacterium]